MRGVRSSRSCVSDPRPSPRGLPPAALGGTGWDGPQAPALGGLKSLELQGAGEGVNCLEGAEAQGTSPARHLFRQRLGRLGRRLRMCRGTAPKLFWLWCAGLGFTTLSGMFGVFLMCIQMCLF